MKKRILSLLLILCMAVSLLPTAVFAEDTGASDAALTEGVEPAQKPEEVQQPEGEAPSQASAAAAQTAVKDGAAATNSAAAAQSTTYTFVLKFDADDGTGAPEDIEKTGTVYAEFTIPQKTPTKEGCDFLGWTYSNTSLYQVNDPFYISSKAGSTYDKFDQNTQTYTKTITAVWGTKPTAAYIANQLKTVPVKCVDTQKTTSYVLTENSITDISRITTDGRAYVCTFQIKPSSYVAQFNEKYGPHKSTGASEFTLKSINRGTSWALGGYSFDYMLRVEHEDALKKLGLKVKVTTKNGESKEREYSLTSFNDYAIGTPEKDSSGNYTCTVTLPRATAVAKYTQDTNGQYTDTDTDDNVTWTLTYSEGAWKVTSDATQTIEVTQNNLQTDKPEKPTVTDLLQLNLAGVTCNNNRNLPSDVVHMSTGYRLDRYTYEANDAVLDADGTYTCKLTIYAAPFVAKYNETYDAHRLVDGEPESKKLTLSWNKDTRTWYVDKDKNDGWDYVLFHVTCEPETTDVYVYFQTVDADGKVISVDRDDLGLTKNGNVGNWYTLGTLKTDTALTPVPAFDSAEVIEYTRDDAAYTAVANQLYAALAKDAGSDDAAKFVRDSSNADFAYADKIEWTGEFKTAKAGDHYVDGGKKNCHAYHFDGVLPLYKATFVTEDETNVTGMPADGYYLYEEQLTMTAPSRPGYKFMGWQVEVESNDGGEIIMSANDPATDEGALLQKDNVYTFTSNNVTFTAVWEADMKTVQIVIYRNGDTTTAYKTVPLHQMQKGTTLDLTTIDINDYYTNQGSAGKTDFDFDGWYNDGTWNKYVQDTENPPAGLEKITVNGWTNIICMVYDYEKVVYFQTAEALKDYQEDHSKTEGLLYSTIARKGSALPTADAPTATREGYTFQFWSREGQSSDVTGQTVNGWTNLYANWELTEYTITYNYRDKDIRDKANLQPTNPDKYTVEDAITLNPITNTGMFGKTFAEWRCDLDGDSDLETLEKRADGTSIVPKGTTGDLTISAYWNYPVNYTVFDKNDDKIERLSKTEYVSEDVLSSEDGYTLTALTEYGYDFDGWYQDKKDMNGGSTIGALKTAKKWELYGKLTRKEYTVSSDLRVNGNEQYKDGRDFPWTTTVSGLYGANVDYDTLLLAMKTMALKADAANEPNKDRVDIKLHWNDGHGKVFEPQTYGAEGYNWRDMGNGRNVAYAWGYAYTYYDVGFETGEGATNVDSQLVKSGDKLTAITAPTKEGYAFTGWTIKDTNAAFNPAENAVTRSMTLVAGWTANKYTVTFNPNADDAKVAPANKEVTYDAPYGELPTPTRENYRFVGWYLNGERVTEDTIVKTAGDHTLLAGWSRSYYALTINYVDKNGKKLEESYEASVALGADYSVTSPKIKGYKLKCKDDAVITGTMTAAGFTYDVVYLKVTGNGGGVTITESPNKIKPKAPKLALNTADHFAYVDGYPDGTVKPEGDVTRAETAAILYRIMDDECRAYYETSTSTYADVSRSDWFSTYVATLEKAGVIADTRAYEKFRPNEAITRAELASMLAQFAGLKSASTANFNDVGSHYWAADEIAIAAKMGWINGYPDGSFRPNATVTRAELMAMVNRALERTPQSEDDLLSGMKTWRDNANVDAWYYLDVQEATNDHTYTKSGDHETWKKLL